MTHRAPHFTRIGPRARDPGLLTWTKGVQSGLNPTPFIQRQWNWPNPNRPVQNYGLRTWLHIQQIPQAAVVQSPFNRSDWPNPQQKRTSVEFSTWIDGLPQAALSATLPPRTAEQPNPSPVRRGSLSWFQSGQFIQELAPFVTGWPDPLPRPANRDLLSWSRSGQIQPQVQTNPFAQRDWPNPAPKAPNLELRTWAQGLPRSALSLTVPPTQKDWPNPVLRKPNFEFRTWVTWSQLQPPPPKPFAQTEWPNPVLAKFNLELRDWKQALPPGEIRRTVPPVQLDWPNPPLGPARSNPEWIAQAPLVLGIPPAAVTGTVLGRIFVMAAPDRVLLVESERKTFVAKPEGKTFKP